MGKVLDMVGHEVWSGTKAAGRIMRQGYNFAQTVELLKQWYAERDDIKKSMFSEACNYFCCPDG